MQSSVGCPATSGKPWSSSDIFSDKFFSLKFVNLLETADLENFQTASQLQKC